MYVEKAKMLKLQLVDGHGDLTDFEGWMIERKSFSLG